MEKTGKSFPLEALTRRQFGTILAGGALLLVGGGVYGGVARTYSGSGIDMTTPFGAVTVVRAGRFARLDTAGHQTSSHIAAATAHLAPMDPPAVPGSRVQAHQVSGIRGASGNGHGHGDLPPAGSWPQPLNLTWGDVVVLEVRVQNDGTRTVLFAPGQLRLRLLSSGTTITPQDWNRGPGPLEAGTAEMVMLTYLAPPEAESFALDYNGPQTTQDAHIVLPLLPSKQVSL